MFLGFTQTLSQHRLSPHQKNPPQGTNCTKKNLSFILYFHDINFILLLITSCEDNTDHSKCRPKDNNQEIEVQIRDSSIQLLSYTKMSEQIFTEGDIALTNNKALVTTGSLWNNGKIYYHIHSELPNKDRVHQAIKVWQNGLPKNLLEFINIKDRTDVSNYIEFKKSTGCWSYVGMIGGRQQISLADKCGLGTTIHEIGHALGLWHEQSRSDRNDFVKINWCNIKEKERYNFKKLNTNVIILGNYDYGSIMHYTRRAFAIRGKSIESVTDIKVPSSRKDKPSTQDFKAIECLYGPSSCSNE